MFLELFVHLPAESKPFIGNHKTQMRKLFVTAFITITTFALTSCGGNSQNVEKEGPLDFSAVWTSHQDYVLGYVGENYQRFYFLIDSIRMDTEDTLHYHVWGKYRIKDRVSCYEGKVRILGEISTLPKKYQVDEEVNPQSGTQIYGITSEWNLNAIDINERIKGKMISTFYIKDGKAVFDDIDHYSDSFCNNQFEGILSSPTTSEQKCCWGACRIPDCGDLDIGEGEFLPNEKYLTYGWQSYHDASVEGTEEGWEKEIQSRWNLESDTIQKLSTSK